MQREYKILGVPPDADDAQVMQAYAEAYRGAEGNVAVQMILEQAFVFVMQQRGWLQEMPAEAAGEPQDGPERRPASDLPPLPRMPRKADYENFWQWLSALQLWRRDRAVSEAALHPYSITGQRVSYFFVNLELCLAAAVAVFCAAMFNIKGSTGPPLFFAVLGIWTGTFTAVAVISRMLRSIGGILIGVAAGFLLWRFGAVLGSGWWPWAFWIIAGVGALIMLAKVLPAVTVPTHKASQARWVLLGSAALAVLAPLILIFS